MEIWKLFLFIFSVIHVMLGLAGFIVFGYFKNYSSCVLAIIAGIAYAFLSHLHLLYLKRTLHLWYSSPEFKQMARFGLFIICIGASSLTYFTVIQIMLKKPILPIDDSSIISIVWSLITIQGGSLLLYHSCRYKRNPESVPLLSGETAQETVDGSDSEGNPNTSA